MEKKVLFHTDSTLQTKSHGLVFPQELFNTFCGCVSSSFWSDRGLSSLLSSCWGDTYSGYPLRIFLRRVSLCISVWYFSVSSIVRCEDV